MSRLTTTPTDRRALPWLGIALAVVVVLVAVPLVVSRDSATTTAADDPTLENDELVLAELAPNGLPTTARLVSTVTARGGEERLVEDPASTVNVGYVNRRGSPATGQGVVLVEVGGPGTTTAVTEATFDRPLPVAVHAEYTLDGSVVPPDDVVGADGDLTVRYTVTNTTAQPTTVTYTDADGTTRRRDVPVFVPFAGALDVVLDPDVDVVDAPGAARATDERGRTVLRYSVLLAPPLGSFQVEAQARLAVQDAATPEVRLEVLPATSATDPATGFSSDALAGAVEGNSELAAGLEELSGVTGQLADGAGVLSDGADALASGASVVAAEVSGTLTDGSRLLDSGASQLADGVGALQTGLAEADSGAGRLAAGLDELSAGLDELVAGFGLLAGPDGLPRAAESGALLAAAAEQIADRVGSVTDGPWPPPGSVPGLPDLPGGLTDGVPGGLPDDLDTALGELEARLADPSVPGGLGSRPDASQDDLVALVERSVPDLATLPDGVPPPTLTQSVRLLGQATTVLGTLSAALAASVGEQEAALRDAATAATDASVQAVGLASEVCGSPPVLTAEQCARLGQVVERTGAAASATTRAAEAGLAQAVLAAALVAGTTGLDAALGLVEQAVLELSGALRSGNASAPGLTEGLALLSSGLADSVEAARALQSGAEAAAAGGAQLAAGADALADGLGEATSGVDRLAEGARALADGTAANAAGVDTLASGTQDLAAGAKQAAEGSEQLADGVEALRTDGIDEVADAVAAAVAEPALAAAWLAATDARAADALPYGPPDGAVGHAAYRLTMPSTDSASVPAWQWWVLAALGAGAAAALVYRRVTDRSPRAQD